MDYDKTLRFCPSFWIFYHHINCEWRENRELNGFGLEFEMQHRLIRKLEKAGATSMEKAVTFEEAKLDDREEYWLDYFAGVFLGKIKKTKNRRYYVINQ